VLDAAGGTLHLATAAPQVEQRHLPLEGASALELARLRRCTPAEGMLATAARVGEALAGAGIDHRFFRAFRQSLDALAAALPGPASADARHAYALLQMVRVLFLYFVQSRGWLDGRDDFLIRAVDATLAARKPLHRHLLRTLFFGTLDRPASHRAARARALGAIPYLNGGLFAPHALDRRWPAGPSDEAWRAAFDGLFERFHFTVREGDAQAIAPDMLGRVFEGVMHPASRRRSGTFYTPASLVRDVLTAGLRPLLASRLDLSEHAAELALQMPDAATARVLANVTVLDPAVGSGAFLLGALDLLAAARVAQGEAPAAAKRAILGRQLFGVDLEPGAVRLCELRLWLSVLADEPDAPPSRVRPLPNLDALVRQGDSLLDPIGPTTPDRTTGHALAVLRARVVRSHGEAAHRALRALRRAEHAAAAAALTARLDACEARIGALLAAARTPTLLDAKTGLNAQGRRQLADYRAERRTLRSLARQLQREQRVPWFRYETHFADIAARGGFDLIAGNPPWVRGEVLEPALRRQLEARYRWWRRGGNAGFSALPDLSVAFVERAMELAAPDGVVALLLPAKLASTQWGAAARGALATRHTLHALAPLAPRGPAAFDATVYPLALIAGRAAPSPTHAVRLGLSHAAERRAQSCYSAGSWPLGPGAAQERLASLAERHGTISEQATLVLGVKTGCDAALVLTDTQAAAVDSALLRPAIRGRDVQPFRATPSRHLLYAYDAVGRPLAMLGAGARRHLEPHLGALARRRDLTRGPPWTLFRTGQLRMAHRVVWADIGLAIRAAVLEAPERDGIALNTCYVAGLRTRSRAQALAAWLNAPLVSALARIGAPPAAGGFARFGLRTIGALPLPDGALDDPELQALGAAAASGTTLDDCVARLLGLDDEARRDFAARALEDAARWRR
jgi:hypothetical protein